jgi:PAS domain S-box-containing protein
MSEEIKMSRDFEDRILREQVRLAMQQVPTMQATSFIVALVLSFTVRDMVPYRNILVWLLITLSIALSRIMLYHGFRRVREGPFPGEYWRNVYLALALISGIIWGLSAFIVFPAGSPELISIFVLVIASLSAATTVSHSSIRLAPTAWAGPAMLLYAIRCFMEGEQFGYTVGLLILLYLLTVLRYSFNHNKSITSAIALRFENLELIEEVQKSDLILRQEITERKRTEEELLRYRDHLDELVKERTAALAKVNERLSHEIEDHKQTDNALRESESRAKAMLQAIPDLMFRMDSQGVFLDYKADIRDLHAQSEPTLIGKRNRDITPPEFADLIDRQIRTTLETGTQQTFEYQLTIPGRGVRDFEARMVASGADEVTAIVRNVTRRKRIEAALRNAKKQWEGTFDAISDWVCVIDKDQNIIRSNKSADRFCQYPVEELIGKCCYEIVHGTANPVLDCPAVRAFKSRQREELEFRVEDGRWLHISVDPMEGSQNNGELFVHVARDITRRKQAEAERAKLEAQNRQLQKAESLGRMAGAVAHHFNNQIGAVMGNLELAMIDLPSGSDVKANLAEAMKASHRAAEVSGLMLTYLGQTSAKRDPIDLSEACHRALPLLKAGIPKHVVLDHHFPSPGPTVSANPNQIQQVLANLLTNAWEAFGDDLGAIHLAVKTVSSMDIPASHRFPISWQPDDSAYACLEVEDAGCGIMDKDIEKLFDPFFSSKFTGRGMGLSAVLGIVRAHGGAVTVESIPGRGSVFRAFFPMSAEEIPRQPDEAAKAREMEGAGAVLLVEDEEALRNMAATMLTRLGFTVLTAKDGVEAVEVFQQHQDEIRCVLCDLTMPRMNGWETLATLRTLRPSIPVVLASGYDEARVMAGGHPERPQAFLSKPYDMAQLKAALSRMMVISAQVERSGDKVAVVR